MRTWIFAVIGTYKKWIWSNRWWRLKPRIIKSEGVKHNDCRPLPLITSQESEIYEKQLIKLELRSEYNTSNTHKSNRKTRQDKIILLEYHDNSPSSTFILNYKSMGCQFDCIHYRYKVYQDQKKDTCMKCPFTRSCDAL